MNRELSHKKVSGFIETDIIGLDGVFAGKGIPRGELIEIFGEEDSGKSSLALHLVRSVQKNEGVAAYVDIEGKLEAGFADKLGVKIADLLISQPDCAEDVFGLCEILALGGAVELIVIDSVAALLPRIEVGAGYESNDSDQEYQIQVEVVLRGMRKLEGVAKQTGCCIILINQLRGNFDSNTASTMISTGGRSIKFRAGMRVQLFKSGYIVREGECLGLNIKAVIIKNAASIINQSLWLVLYFNSGFSLIEGLLLNALERKVLSRYNDGVYYNSTYLGGSRSDVCKYLICNSALYHEIIDAMKL